MHKRLYEDISNFIFMSDKPKKADVVCIPGTSRWETSEKAAELYRAGLVTYIVPSGKYSSNRGRFPNENITKAEYAGDYATEFLYMKNILMLNGVDEEGIIEESEATNTMENAAFTARVLSAKGLEVKSMILSCQSFHARRVFMSYSMHFPETEMIVIPTDTQDISKVSWFLQENSYRRVMKEVEKCGKYFKEF